jgi:hypothetical protein
LPLKVEEEKDMTAEQQQQKKDDIIESILDHQGELLDEKYIRIIVNTMRRIPLDVIDTIASDRNIRFLTITDQFFAVVKNLYDPYGAYPPEQRGVAPSVTWQLVIINDMTMNKLNPEDKQTVIAHELAHVYLEHDFSPSNEKGKDAEQEADDLIRTWGFNPNIDRSNQYLKHEDGSQSQGAQTA